MRQKIIIFISGLLVCAFLLAGCSRNTMKDGYYTAEMSDFSNGWREYVCIQVKDDNIVSAEFNAKDKSGFIKAWDNEYMRNMESMAGTYPNKYTREYVQQLIQGQKNTKVDAVTGATGSGENFEKLVEAVIQQAKKGDSKTVMVASPKE